MHWRGGLVFFSIMVALAAASAALAALIDTATWTSWFEHPAQPRQELTRQGAILWRSMLGVAAAMLLLTAILLPRLQVPQPAPLRAPMARSAFVRLIGVIVLGLAFRATRLNESLWYDEIASWMTYAGGAKTAGAVAGTFLDPINHAAHTLLNWYSVRAFASSLGVELAFRLPALVFSLLAIAAMFGLMRRTAGERAALVAATLTAILPVSVLEGVEARGYSMMIFFSALMTWTLLEARQSTQPRAWVTYSLLCALGIWSHFVAAFVPIGHALWLVWRGVRFNEWRQAVGGAAALALGAAITITLYSPMIPGMLAARGMFAASRGDEPTLLGAEGLHALLQLGGSWYWWAALPGLLLAVIGVVQAIRSRAAGIAVELAFLGLPLMITGIALSGSWVYARFTLFAFPGAILLMALGIDRAWRWRSWAGTSALAVLLLCSIIELSIRPPKQPLRDAADYVRDCREADDNLLVVGLAHEVLRLYAADLNLSYSFHHGQDLPRKLASTNPEWIVIEYPGSVTVETYQLIQGAGFEKAEQFAGWADWSNGDVHVWRRRK